MRGRSQIVRGLLCVLFIAGCVKGAHNRAKELEPTPPETRPDTLSVFTLVGNAPDGRKKWQIQGETANLGEETVTLSPVTATNFGRVDVHLTAQRGTYHKVTQDVHLEEDVVVTTTDGAWLTTDSLDWSAQREMGKTQDWVRVTRPGMVVVGKGAVDYPKLKRVRLEEEVTVTLEGHEGKTVVTCEGPLEVDYGHSKARFWRNVRVEDRNGVIQSDRMDLFLDPQTKQVREATFWGHVKIHHENQVAFSNRALYWQDPARTVLIGHPKLIMLPGDKKMAEII